MTAPLEAKMGADSVSGLVRADPGTDPEQYDDPDPNPDDPPVK